MAKIGIVLGSGLNQFTKELSHKTLLYQDVKGVHRKKIYTGFIDNIPVTVFCGRTHIYEGDNQEKILFNITKAKEFNLDFLIITNAAGGLNPIFKVTDLMLITSHIDFLYKKIRIKKTPVNYDKTLITKLKSLARANRINLRDGVYCVLPGPSYETKTEITFQRKIGADAAGMSTVPELFYASQLGIKTIGISCITNILNPQLSQNINHNEVINAGKSAYNNFSKLLRLIIKEFGE
jgi:purine-nucleoside phosphorylase